LETVRSNAREDYLVLRGAGRTPMIQQVSPVLEYAKHCGRLSRIGSFVHFVIGAIDEREVSLPQKKEYIAAKEKVVEGFRMAFQAFENPPELDPDAVRKVVDSAFIVPEPSKQLVCNLALVMAVTEIEIFLEHLIDVILAKDPRRLKGLAFNKQLTAAELVELANYEDVMRRLRQKVSKQVLDLPAKEMFVRLGGDFDLFREEEFVFRANPKWGIAEIEAVWKTRHKIVHEGELPVAEEYFNSVFLCFAWMMNFLSFRARKNFGLQVDYDFMLNAAAAGYKKLGKPLG
jgi:hypothetical protein